MTTVHGAVARTVAEQGTTTVFGLMGDGNFLIVTDLLGEHAVRFVASVDEGGAVSMADGYSRVTGAVGVASVTHGPALTNTMTALVEAVRNRSQLLLITGQTPSMHQHLQAIDIPSLVATAGAGYERVHRADSAARDAARAFHRVHSELRPIVLDVPFDLLELETAQGVARPGIEVPARPWPEQTGIDRALGVALSANRPLILAGRGAVTAGAGDALRELADLLAAPLATTLLAKDLFAGHPLDLGTCGTLSTVLAGARIAGADCVIAFGAGLNRFTTGGGGLFDQARIVHVDIDPAQIGLHAAVDVAVVGDALAAAEAMIQSLRDAGQVGPAAREAELRRRLAAATPEDDFTDRSTDRRVDLRTATIKLDRLLPPDRVVVTDAGRFLQAPWRFLHVSDPRSFLQTANFGSIGLGLATAIGAAVGAPGRPTVAMVGDGGFMMSSAEFRTAVRQRLPLIVVVANDGAYGAEWSKFEEHGIDATLSLNDWPDFAALAVALGGRAHTVRQLADLDAVPALLAAGDGPILLDLWLDPGLDIRF